MNNVAALLKAKPPPKPRTVPQLLQSKLFQESGQLARLQINAATFSRGLYGPDLATARKFIELVNEACKKNKAAMQNIPKYK